MSGIGAAAGLASWAMVPLPVNAATPPRTGNGRAAHRKPRPRPIAGAAAWTAAGLTLATAGALHGSAIADPQPTAAEVQERVDTLHHEAEEATERYNGATESAEQAQDELDRLRDRAARSTAELNRSRDALGAHAAAEYRSGGLSPTLQLALASKPDDYLSRASVLERAAERQGGTALRLEQQLAGIEELRSEAAGQTEALRAAQREARRERTEVQGKLEEAERLLDRLTAEERERVLASEGHGAEADQGAAHGPGAERADRAPAPREQAPAASGRAAAALGFAQAQLGKPYGWGATGPDSFDCSGLTQAAWRAAGVELPRTSYSQVNAGTRVSRSELAPGDLVFYYSGLTHVGMYVGGGQIIHASRPGTPVRYAPVDSMPLVAATRPG